MLLYNFGDTLGRLATAMFKIDKKRKILLIALSLCRTGRNYIVSAGLSQP